MVMRWLSCGTERLHIVGTCPNCYATQGGLLLGTAANAYAGRITVRCVDCGMSADYYVDSTVEKIWRLDPVESKSIPLNQ